MDILIAEYLDYTNYNKNDILKIEIFGSWSHWNYGTECKFIEISNKLFIWVPLKLNEGYYDYKYKITLNNNSTVWINDLSRRKIISRFNNQLLHINKNIFNEKSLLENILGMFLVSPLNN
jgi:hypothetical protein